MNNLMDVMYRFRNKNNNNNNNKTQQTQQNPDLKQYNIAQANAYLLMSLRKP